jgi:hypothetical protein
MNLSFLLKLNLQFFNRDCYCCHCSEWFIRKFNQNIDEPIYMWIAINAYRSFYEKKNLYYKDKNSFHDKTINLKEFELKE